MDQKPDENFKRKNGLGVWKDRHGVRWLYAINTGKVPSYILRDVLDILLSTEMNNRSLCDTELYMNLKEAASPEAMAAIHVPNFDRVHGFFGGHPMTRVQMPEGDDEEASGDTDGHAVKWMIDFTDVVISAGISWCVMNRGSDYAAYAGAMGKVPSRARCYVEAQVADLRSIAEAHLAVECRHKEPSLKELLKKHNLNMMENDFISHFKDIDGLIRVAKDRDRARLTRELRELGVPFEKKLELMRDVDDTFGL
jgi:hypothetical protein